MGFFDQERVVSEIEGSEQKDFEPVPEGWYECLIHSVESRTTKSGGEMAAFRFDIIGPSHQGRVVFININTANPPGKVYEDSSKNPAIIGGGQIKTICEAAGIERIKGPNSFAGKRLQVKFGIDPGKDGYGPQNRFKGAKASANAIPAGLASAGTTTSSGGAKAPWDK